MKNRRTQLLITATITACITLTSLGGIIAFQQGVNGYTGTLDTYLDRPNADTSQGNASTVNPRNKWPEKQQGLIRFDGIFGTGAGQIDPAIALEDITSATLKLYLTSAVDGKDDYIWRMTADWDETTTWNSMSVDGGLDFSSQTVGYNNQDDIVNVSSVGWYSFDVTDSIMDLLQSGDPAANNDGWALYQKSQTAHGAHAFASSENETMAIRPLLEVQLIPEPASLVLLGLGGLVLTRRRLS